MPTRQKAKKAFFTQELEGPIRDPARGARPPSTVLKIWNSHIRDKADKSPK